MVPCIFVDPSRDSDSPTWWGTEDECRFQAIMRTEDPNSVPDLAERKSLLEVAVSISG